jgi:hypothetical protein
MALNLLGAVSRKLVLQRNSLIASKNPVTNNNGPQKSPTPVKGSG